MKEFLAECEKFDRKLDLAQEIDAALVWYLTNLFLQGYDLSKGVYTVIGFEGMYPRYGKQGDLGLPRAHRALKGWRRLAPPRSRVGVVWYVVAGVAACLLRDNHFDMAAWVVMAHGCYLRPASCMTLRRRCLVSPIAGATTCWAILLSASQYQLRSKTGTSDDSVFWDVKGLEWYKEILAALAVGDPDEKVWSFDYRELCIEIKKASDLIGVPFVPYMLRHSGPSWDRMKNYRTLQEIQKRGLWESHKSVARYEQGARSGSEYKKIDQKMREWLEDRAAQLADHFLLNTEMPAPP